MSYNDMENEEVEERLEACRQFKKAVIRSVRQATLQRLLLLWYALFIEKDSWIRRKVEERLTEKGLLIDRENIAYELKPEDVMQFLNCSKRTAIDYIQTLQILCL